ncbi:unnamed protein product [Darwinula stevensoni]|uniref:Uncharacterized protein n=1 Tax=Darwinula stevensoni TaxID=69355 RepID=A0A7R8XF81_9CRUS|nr:unnamed protein product [Darwinula stevensoni]CAG0891353.1 unnamed protein product [Darwinula stevensoni]
MKEPSGTKEKGPSFEITVSDVTLLSDCASSGKYPPLLGTDTIKSVKGPSFSVRQMCGEGHRNSTNLSAEYHLLKQGSALKLVGKVGQTPVESSEIFPSELAGLERCFIGVVDGKTLQMHLLETAQVIMAPKIPEKASPATPAKENQTPEDKLKERRERFQKRTGEFGSKKLQVVLKRSLRQEEAAVDQQEMGQIAEQMKPICMETREQMINSLMKPLPPCNREASDVADVYSRADIISDSIWTGLDSCATSFLEASKEELEEWKVPGKMSDFFWNHVGANPSAEKLKLLLYIESIIFFASKPLKIIKYKTHWPAWLPQFIGGEVCQYFFGDVTMRQLVRTAESINKLLCHAIVVAFLATNFRFEVDTLVKSLQVKFPKFRTALHMTGGELKRDRESSKSYAILKIPLFSLDELQRMSGTLSKRRRN